MSLILGDMGVTILEHFCGDSLNVMIVNDYYVEHFTFLEG